MTRRAPTRPSLAALSTAAATVLGACYQYAPPPSTQIAPEASVRVVLTDAGAMALTSAVGPRVELIDGRLERADADSVVVRVTQTTNLRGVETDWTGERVAMARSSVASVRTRRLDRTRTALALAAGAGLLAATIIGFNTGQSAGGGGARPLPTPR